MILKNNSKSDFPKNVDLSRIAEAKHHDPFSVLGKHGSGKSVNFLAYRPSADQLFIKIGEKKEALLRINNTDFFYCNKSAINWPAQISLIEVSKTGIEFEFFDPYTFLPVLDEKDLIRFNTTSCWDSYQLFGSHPIKHQGVDGVLFSLWAPGAERVSVIGEFNNWDGRVHPMRCRGNTGVWELFLPDISADTLYKYEIRNQQSGELLVKADPYARHYEFRPNTASRVQHDTTFDWQDQWWLNQRKHKNWLQEPMSIYEVHLASWRRTPDGSYLSYKELAHQLVDYVKNHHFTHIELLPITEYPYDGSWGYQVTGYFAPTSRFGSCDDFKFFVDLFHKNGIGVILDWVPAHFPKDEHALARFDGSELYEHADPRLGEHKDWDTLIFNFGRREVANFLLSSAHYWLSEFHIDGLRVDAVASMLYLDYSREEGEWLPNRYGGNENLEAIEFVRELNCVLHEHFPGSLVIAEESTSWPQVSGPVYLGGLGFSMKWNMGWMNDILSYFQQDPVHRQYHHEKLTFGLLYAFTENFVLPFSHDEVVHGKRSLLEKMPGDTWQQFANLRLLYTFMYAYPGKKLLFMGDEFGQGREWSHDRELDWQLLELSFNKGVQQIVMDLGRLYKSEAALYQFDFSEEGFHWIDCHDSSQSVICFSRQSENDFIVVILNFTPIPRYDYRIGVPQAGVYEEILNSDSAYYAGSNVFNGVDIISENTTAMGFEQSLVLTLPPLGGLYLKLKNQ